MRGEREEHTSLSILLKSSLGLIFLSLLLTGCRNPFAPQMVEGELPYLLPTTPEAVISNLKMAYNSKDLEGYLACLDRDSFRFYFDPSDTTIDEILKDNWGIDSLFWGYFEEKISTSTLFQSVETIYLELVKESVDPGTSPTRKTLNYLYLLSIEPAPPGLETVEGRAKFTLKKNPSNNYWYIITWRDYSFTR